MRLPNDPKGRAALLACLLCASCASVTPDVPWSLLEDCYVPGASPQTNGELYRYTRSLRDALTACNDDKKALREWAGKQP